MLSSDVFDLAVARVNTNQNEIRTNNTCWPSGLGTQLKLIYMISMRKLKKQHSATCRKIDELRRNRTKRIKYDEIPWLSASALAKTKKKEQHTNKKEQNIQKNSRHFYKLEFRVQGLGIASSGEPYFLRVGNEGK